MNELDTDRRRALIVAESEAEFLRLESSLEELEVSSHHVASLGGLLEALAGARWSLIICGASLSEFGALGVPPLLTDESRGISAVLLTKQDNPRLSREALKAGYAECFPSDAVDRLRRFVGRSLELAELERRVAELEQRSVEREPLDFERLQAERLQAIGSLASVLAHEFNNGLSLILGFSELLLSGPEQLADVEKVNRYLTTIHRRAGELAETVSRLRRFYRKSELRLSAVDVSDLLADVQASASEALAAAAKSHGCEVRLRCEVCPNPVALGQRAELCEALLAIVINAIEAQREDGEVVLAIEQRPDWLQVEIRDQGVGMDPETRRRCVEPFFTTKRLKGAGFGLAYSYGIIANHKGRLEVESEPGRGATVRVLLTKPSAPVDPAPSTLKAPSRAAPSDPTATSTHVLIVDDEPELRELLEEYMRSLGHAVTKAGDGGEGLERFREGRFDLVIVDKSMPIMNGEQLALEIKKLAPRTPVILLTGFGDFINAQGEIPAGLDLVMRKPVTLKELRDAISGLLITP